MNMILLVLAVGLFALAFLILLLPQHRRGGQDSYCAKEREHMPPEIGGGTLVLSEETVRVRHPAKIVAKPDQVYLTTDRLLVPVENKTRKVARVYDADKAELAVQAFALRHGRTGRLKRYAVANYGYVAIRIEGRPPSYHRVELLTDEAIVSMRHRRIALEQGSVPPSAATSPGQCLKCSKAATCPRVRTTH